MALYKYTAMTLDGKNRHGAMEAANEKALKEQLKEQGLYLVSVKDSKARKEYRRLTSKQLADFCREMSSLLSSGVSLVRALDIIVSEEGLSSDLKSIYTETMNDVKKGTPLSEAMENRNCFPDLMLGLVRSGEGNGNIDVVMERLAIQYDRQNYMKQQVKSAMTYPIILLILCVVIVAVIVAFVIPQFEELFNQMESLPIITEILLAVSHFIGKWWYMLIIAGFLLFVLIRTISRIHSVRRGIDYLKVHLPVFGKLNKVIYTARFSRTLSSLYSGGMPISYAIITAADTVNNIYIKEQFEEVGTQVRSGVPLSQALKKIDGFMPKLSSMVYVGEESGRLDSMLDSIAINLESESEAATKRMVIILEPLMIVVMAVLIGFVVAAVMLPIYQSYSAIEASR